jgi:hypothetical protein
MAAGEGMAIRFYKRYDAGDLAEQVSAILQSQELQHQMAEHNFAAGIEMTLASVVKNYLRWFELNKCKRAMSNGVRSAGLQHLFLRPLQTKQISPGWNLEAALLAHPRDERASRQGSHPAEAHVHLDTIADTFNG